MTELTDEQLAELRRIAEAATPGPREWDAVSASERISALADEVERLRALTTVDIGQMSHREIRLEYARAALAAADAKRAELDGGAR